MNTSLKLFRLFYLIGFCLIFLPTFVFYYVPNTNANIPIGAFFWLGLPICLFIQKPQTILNFYKSFFLNKLNKLYLIWIAVILLTSITHMVLGFYKVHFNFYFVRMLHFFVICAGITLFIPLFKLFKIPCHKLIKVFFLMIFVVFLIGIFEWFSNIFSITIVKSILSFFTNQRTSLYLYLLNGVGDTQRIHSVFGEPSGFGQFIFIMMPFVMNIAHTRLKIFKNVVLNFMIKKSFIPLMLINLILTESPIYLVLCGIEFILLVLWIYRKFIKKYFKVIFASLLIASLIFFLLNDYLYLLKNTYIKRILVVLECISSYETMSILEPSLVSRINSYIVQFVIFTKNSLWGVGLYNSECFADKLYLELNLPYTIENLNGYYMIPNLVGLNKSLIWTMLAEFGIIGITIYFLYIYKILYFVNTIKQKFNEFHYVFLVSVSQVIIVTFLISFYNFYLDNHFIWLIYSMCTSFYILLNKKGK